jgi:hypothetical protein
MGRKMRTGSIDVCKYAGGTAKHIVFKLYALVYRDIVLDTDAVANLYPGPDIDILPQGTVAADYGSGLHVAEMPYLGPGANHGTVVYITAFVKIII